MPAWRVHGSSTNIKCMHVVVVVILHYLHEMSKSLTFLSTLVLPVSDTLRHMEAMPCVVLFDFWTTCYRPLFVIDF